MASMFNVSAAGSHFPALKQQSELAEAKGTVFFDNAGGSQTLGSVIEDIRDYLSTTNVQLGGSYATSKSSGARYGAGYEAAANFINASPDEIVLGPSTTQLFRNLSFALSFPVGSEILISKLDHESNIGAWVALAERQNLTVKWWLPTNAESTTNPKLEAGDDLKALLSPKTKLVALTHASNILGTIHDIKAITKCIHDSSTALVVVDAVAYAPHRPIDVQYLGVDFYAFSWYKVYGPHISMLYGSTQAQTHLASLGHYFRPSNTLEDKLALAGSNYELTASIPRVLEYFGADPSATWAQIAAHEEELQDVLLSYLRSRPDCTIYGESSSSSQIRVPTVSFVIAGVPSRQVVAAVEAKTGFAFRWGKYYSVRLVDDVLGLDDDGVVRISMVHYNTVEEIKAFVKALDEYVPPKKGDA